MATTPNTCTMRAPRARECGLLVNAMAALLLTLALWCAGAPAGAAEPAATQAYKFGSFPMVTRGQVERVFSPVAAEFSRILAHPVHLRTKPSFAQYRKELSREGYDIAIVQPFDYILAHDRYNYLPLVRFEKPLFASFMVLADSPLKDLQDLAGKAVAFPPTTAAVSHMGRKAFIDAGMDTKNDVELKFRKSHDSCLQLLLVRKAAACVSSLRAVHIFESKWGEHFRVLYNTPSIPNSLFIVHRRVPDHVRKKLIQTMASWPGASEAGREFVKNSNNMRLVPADNAEYDVVRNFPRPQD